MHRAFLIALLLLPAGCQSGINWRKADEYVPLVGERCQNFQCVMSEDDPSESDEPYAEPVTAPPVIASQERKHFPPPSY